MGEQERSLVGRDCRGVELLVEVGMAVFGEAIETIVDRLDEASTSECARPDAGIFPRDINTEDIAFFRDRQRRQVPSSWSASSNESSGGFIQSARCRISSRSAPITLRLMSV